jgi:hypothetical protein
MMEVKILPIFLREIATDSRNKLYKKKERFVLLTIKNVILRTFQTIESILL